MHQLAPPVKNCRRILLLQSFTTHMPLLTATTASGLQYDTRSYFNVRSKADISQLNLLHGTKKIKEVEKRKN